MYKNCEKVLYLAIYKNERGLDDQFRYIKIHFLSRHTLISML